MADIWKAGPDVISTMQDLIANHFPKLASIDDQILVVFKEKASKVGDAVVAGKTSKAGPLLSVVGDREYEFTIVLAADEWQSFNGTEQRALLFHHLCACGAEENPQTGDLKTFVRVPDVNFFREEVQEFGFWRTSGKSPDPNLILELFGEEPGNQIGNPTKVAAPPPTPVTPAPKKAGSPKKTPAAPSAPAQP